MLLTRFKGIETSNQDKPAVADPKLLTRFKGIETSSNVAVRVPVRVIDPI